MPEVILYIKERKDPGLDKSKFIIPSFLFLGMKLDLYYY